jgi:hypothetical protein
MPLQSVLCTGRSTLDVTTGESTVTRDIFFECIKVKKVFDEFGLRDCVEGIEFEVPKKAAEGEIDPTLILRCCKLSDVCISDASRRAPNGTLIEKRLRFSGKCCCDVYGKDECGDTVRLKVKKIPYCATRFSIGCDGELCYSFSVRREYNAINSISDEDFERLLHFIDEGRFELQCLAEAIIDEENNEVCNETLVTNLGIFLVVKFDTEVQLCVPVLGYCEVVEDVQADESFCEDVFPLIEFPEFNPPQLTDNEQFPY